MSMLGALDTSNHNTLEKLINVKRPLRQQLELELTLMEDLVPITQIIYLRLELWKFTIRELEFILNL